MAVVLLETFFGEEAITSLRKGGLLMSAELVIDLIALIVAIITLVLMAFRLGMQINDNSKNAKNDRQTTSDKS